LSNDGTGGLTTGNYNVEMETDYPGRPTRYGRVEGYGRESQSSWTLVGAALKMFGHTRHPPALLKAQYGRSAGPRRNSEMLLKGPEMLLAFPGGKGTADMVDKAERYGLEILKIDW